MIHGAGLNDLAVSPDGKRALTAGAIDRLVKVWDLTTGRFVHVFDGHVGAVLGVADILMFIRIPEPPQQRLPDPRPSLIAQDRAQ